MWESALRLYGFHYGARCVDQSLQKCIKWLRIKVLYAFRQSKCFDKNILYSFTDAR